MYNLSMRTYSPLADWIYRLRTEGFNMTQEDFARELGVAHNTVTRWETDARTPSGATLKLLATMATLKGFDEPMPVPEKVTRLHKRETTGED